MSVLNTIESLPLAVKFLVLLVMGFQGAAFIGWFMMVRRELTSEGTTRRSSGGKVKMS